MKKVILALIVVFAVTGCSNQTQTQETVESKVTKTQNEDTPTEAVAVNTQENAKSSVPALFSISTNDLKNKFNTLFFDYKDLFITKIDITESQETDTSTFNYYFTDELSMVGVLSPDKKIQEITLIKTGGFSEKNIFNFVTAMFTLIMISNNKYTYSDSAFDEAEDLLIDIGVPNDYIDFNNFDDFDEAIVRNGYKYRFKIQDNNISTFSITPAK